MKNNFREVMGLFPTGVSVVSTVDKDQEAYGVTVSSIVSVSLDPRLVLFCLDNQISGLDRFWIGNRILISFLADNQQEISDYFATPGTDRSWKCPHFKRHPDFKLPALAESFAEIGGKIATSYAGGDHAVLLVEVTTASRGVLQESGKGPLVYFRGRYRTLV